MEQPMRLDDAVTLVLMLIGAAALLVAALGALEKGARWVAGRVADGRRRRRWAEERARFKACLPEGCE